MTWAGQFTRMALLVVSSTILSGCFSSGTSGQEEEKEPHFLIGKSRVNAMDFKGAIESFEKALEVNPHSASAHLELGWLLAEKESDPAAAIYHYQRYLKLRPSAENASIIDQHIQILKQDLAKNVLPPALTPAQQRQFEQLAEDKRRLSEEVEKWRAYYASRGTAPVQSASAAGRVENSTQISSQSGPLSGSTIATRTHKVQSGETPSSIARKYGIKVEALMSANPGLNPTRLKIGQTITIPAQ